MVVLADFKPFHTCEPAAFEKHLKCLSAATPLETSSTQLTVGQNQPGTLFGMITTQNGVFLEANMAGWFPMVTPRQVKPTPRGHKQAFCILYTIELYNLLLIHHN